MGPWKSCFIQQGVGFKKPHNALVAAASNEAAAAADGRRAGDLYKHVNEADKVETINPYVTLTSTHFVSVR